jgi:hypothetical protein
MIYIEEKLKDIKWVIRSRTSKDRIRWRKGQTMIYKTKDWAKRTPLKFGMELMFSCREIYGLEYQQYFSNTVSRHRWHLPIFAVMFTTFSVLAHKDFYIIWLLNLSILSEPHEDDSFRWYTRRRYLIYVINYVSDLRQVGDFHSILRFPPHWPTRYKIDKFKSQIM